MLMIKKDFAVIDEISANKVSDAFIIDANWGETKHTTHKSELNSKFPQLNERKGLKIISEETSVDKTQKLLKIFLFRV